MVWVLPSRGVAEAVGAVGAVGDGPDEKTDFFLDDIDIESVTPAAASFRTTPSSPAVATTTTTPPR